MFTVKVIDHRDGRPAEYKKVGIVFKGFFRGLTKDLRTDEYGEAHFDYDNGEGTIYVDGKPAYEGYIEGRIIVYI